MSIRLSLLLLVFMFLYSCKQSKEHTKIFNRDSALKNYLVSLDSLPYYDTTDLNYRALKAYQNNDINFFKEVAEKQKRKAEFNKQWQYLDTCVKLKKLQELGVEMAYRFKYTSAFCSKPIIATVTKKGDKAKLNFIVYQQHYDTSQCRILNEINLDLTEDNWIEFYNKLMFADIWGLKRENNIQGLDGSTMEFMAYENVPSTSRPVRQCYIERWVYSTLGEAFDYLMKLSKNKKGCVWIQ